MSKSKNTSRCLLILAFAATLSFAAPASCAEASGWESTIELPTYALGEDDPNPPFSLVNRHQIYPYTMMDDLTDRREMKTYKAIYLENEYLKAIVLPELGGRLYSLFDKVHKREVFYRNNVVKYGLVSLRGAWISGGIEFNFPNGHTVVTVSHVASRLVTNSDGSATAIVGGMDWVTGMHWEVALTLHPGEARLEQHVTLFNSTPLDNLYWYWANAAVPATQDMQFIYPMREANPHSRTEIWSYPVWKGVDYSWYKNFRQPTSLFGLQVRRNFFGAYYHDSDSGVVHIADYRQVPGKKIWSWGVAEGGLIWTDLLTDHDGAYNEIQSGRYVTQLNQEFIAPQRVESWTEYWYPVHGLDGGFVEATSELAMNVRYLPAKGAAPGRVELNFNPTVDIQGAKLRISVAGKLLHEEGPFNFKATDPQVFTLPVANIESARKSLAVDVTGADSRVLLHWSAADPIDGNRDFVSEAGVHKSKDKSIDDMTAEELYLLGADQEKDGDPKAAEQTYKLALRRNPNYVPALLKLAYRDYSAADFDAAHEMIVKALEQNRTDAAVQYAAGLLFRSTENWSEAESAFSAALKANSPPVAVLVQLGELLTRQKKYNEAAEYLHKALGAAPGNALAASDLAVALRMAGKSQEAAAAAGHANELMPLLPFALVEKWRTLENINASNSSAVESKSSWKSVLNFDIQNYLEVAAWYRSLGDWESSSAVLEEALKDFPGPELSPLVFYYLASNVREQGNLDRASQLLTQAASAPYQKVFPQRLSDARVLTDALSHSPQDAHAHYFLGTFLFAHNRYDDAAKEWLAAKNGGLEDAVLERDLGVYALHLKKNPAEAAGYYENAIHLAPGQYRYYPELDEVYAQLGETTKRDELFAHAPSEVLDHDTVRVRRALLYIQHGEYQNARLLLNDHHYKPWEGGAVMRQIFVLTNLTQGKASLAAKHPVEAERAFRQALEYPANLGVGKPDKPNDEEAWYWLGIALAAQGKSDEAREAWKTAVKEGEEARGASGVFAAASLMKLDRIEEGKKLFASAVDRANRPDAGAQSIFVAGLAEQLQDRESEAQKNFQRALELDPQLWQARVELNRSAAAMP